MNSILQYIQKNDLTLSALAEKIGVSVQSVSRYARGEAVPKKPIMKKLVKVSGGKIQPNDFYKDGVE